MGIPHDSPQRVKAGLQFALSEASEDGHCYLPEGELITKAAELLGVDAVRARLPRRRRADITGLTGVTEAQRAALLALGAVDRST